MDRRLRLHRSTRASRLDRDVEDVWRVVTGGGPGPHWYVDALPLAVRGAIDRAVGGAGRRWPVPDGDLRAGDTAGFWRVVRAERRADLGLLVLEAEVRGPGRVVLTTSVAATGDDGCRVEQDVAFDPDGVLGQLYMLVDLPAREVVIELVHRRLLADVDPSPTPGGTS